jgi:Family of unknown function (DUF5681)
MSLAEMRDMNDDETTNGPRQLPAGPNQPQRSSKSIVPQSSSAGAGSPDDRAGYKRPPRATRFKPGQSGNPTGRRNGSRNLLTDVAEILSGQVVICEGGSERTISRQEAVLLSLYNKGVQGDVKAITSLLNMGARLLETAEPPAQDELSETDLRILENFLRHNGVAEGDK